MFFSLEFSLIPLNYFPGNDKYIPLFIFSVMLECCNGGWELQVRDGKLTDHQISVILLMPLAFHYLHFFSSLYITSMLLLYLLSPTYPTDVWKGHLHSWSPISCVFFFFYFVMLTVLYTVSSLSLFYMFITLLL